MWGDCAFVCPPIDSHSSHRCLQSTHPVPGSALRACRQRARQMGLPWDSQ